MHCTFSVFLKWMFFILLLTLAIWFVREEWSKYLEKSTSFMVTTKEMNYMPVQVICFSPFAKLSVLEFYDENGTLQDVLFNPDMIENLTSWQDFENDVMYKIGKDFDLQLSVYQKGKADLKTNLTEGENIFNDTSIIVYELSTWGNGLCYQMQLPFIKKTLSFEVMFKDSVKSEDIPVVEVYLTSSDNAYGVVLSEWKNGEELKFTLHDKESHFKIKAEETLLLNMDSTCTMNPEECLNNLFDDIDLTQCPNPCLPITFPNNSKLCNELTKCDNTSDMVCMLIEVYDISSNKLDECQKPCAYTEYRGKLYKHTKFEGNDYGYVTWSYKFAFDEVKVNEEYLIYDTVGVIGVVGGTLGLFIGFSFKDLINDIIDFVQKVFMSKLLNK